MKLTFLKAKIHKAKVTGADLNYEGSIAIDPDLCHAAGLSRYERVEIYNITNGHRFATYVIFGKPGEICLNGACARLAAVGDQVIIAAYAELDPAEVKDHSVSLVFVSPENKIIETRKDRVG